MRITIENTDTLMRMRQRKISYEEPGDDCDAESMRDALKSLMLCWGYAPETVSEMFGEGSPAPPVSTSGENKSVSERIER